MASKDIIDKTLDKWDETYVQESKKKIRKKIIFLLAGVILLAGILAVAVYLMLSSYQKSVVNGQVQQMVYLVQSVTNSIEEYVDEYEVTLNVMLQDPVFLEAERSLPGRRSRRDGGLPESTAKSPKRNAWPGRVSQPGWSAVRLGTAGRV